MQLTFDNHERIEPELKALRRQHSEQSTSLKRMTGLCEGLSEHGDYVLFIVDQADAVDDAPPGMPRFSNENQHVVRSFFDTAMSSHMKLAGYTANYKYAQVDEDCQTSEKRVQLYHGLKNVGDCVPVWSCMSLTVNRKR